MNTQAALLTIGDELLIGQTIDTNSAWIAQQLNILGIDVICRLAVGDDRPAIEQALDELLPKVSLVIITGGLGPTADDITKPLLCHYFGGQLVVNEPVLAHIKTIFAARNRPMLERNLKQAEVPDNCTILFNRMGTAPGMWFDQGEKVIISLPGVPFEMMTIMTEEAIPLLQKRFAAEGLIHRTIFTAEAGESFIAEEIQDIEASLPAHIRLAYLPAQSLVRLRLTGKGSNAAQLAQEVAFYQAQLAQRLSRIVVAQEDSTLEALLHRELTAQKRTIGLAESCTGGNIGHLITQVSGASDYFKGSLVCYWPEVKEKILGIPHQTIQKHGVVSEAVAIAMAQNAARILEADYGFGITGMLSKGLDTDPPAGTVWMAACYKSEVKTRKYTFLYDRLRNKDIATQMGLLLLLRLVRCNLE
jgi:nicotinamide-nucleotide amidase